MAQFNLSFEKISTPSRDPSPALPYWDKLRLLFHGRLTMIAKQFTVLLHASLDPYNTTEEMELSWHNCGIVWTNAKIMFKGELNVNKQKMGRTNVNVFLQLFSIIAGVCPYSVQIR